LALALIFQAVWRQLYWGTWGLGNFINKHFMPFFFGTHIFAIPGSVSGHGNAGLGSWPLLWIRPCFFFTTSFPVEHWIRPFFWSTGLVLSSQCH
jgi:hypothetical protein